jgi:hypothetical protein
MAELTNCGRSEAQARLLETATDARAVAESLVGLSIEDARARVTQHGHIVLREIASREQPVTADFRADRITVLVADGTVVEARGGS